ncbi:hypothetical protein PR048_030759 [Dryococelus australis]|uniref:Uncharacterized protein n=1 Tax=Dryococelus australis TaxID=614101 RepID=A0ABQ9GDN5_9NEOP|nr:hypothetical protein PR048_030759 [Dryococelus australis]
MRGYGINLESEYPDEHDTTDGYDVRARRNFILNFFRCSQYPDEIFVTVVFTFLRAPTSPKGRKVETESTFPGVSGPRFGRTDVTVTLLFIGCHSNFVASGKSCRGRRVAIVNLMPEEVSILRPIPEDGRTWKGYALRLVSAYIGSFYANNTFLYGVNKRLLHNSVPTELYKRRPYHLIGGKSEAKFSAGAYNRFSCFRPVQHEINTSVTALRHRVSSTPSPPPPTLPTATKMDAPLNAELGRNSHQSSLGRIGTTSSRGWEYEAAPECKGGEKTGDPRENPPTSGIVRCGSQVQKSGSDPAGHRAQFASVSSLATTPPRSPCQLRDFRSRLKTNRFRQGRLLLNTGQLLRLETRQTRSLSSGYCTSKTSRDGGVLSSDIRLVSSLRCREQGYDPKQTVLMAIPVVRWTINNSHVIDKCLPIVGVAEHLCDYDLYSYNIDSEATQKDMIDCKSFHTVKDISLGQYQLGSPLVDDRPIMNAVKYRVVSGVVWTNRTTVSSNTDTNRTGVLAVVDIGPRQTKNCISITKKRADTITLLRCALLASVVLSFCVYQKNVLVFCCPSFSKRISGCAELSRSRAAEYKYRDKFPDRKYTQHYENTTRQFRAPPVAAIVVRAIVTLTAPALLGQKRTKPMQADGRFKIGVTNRCILEIFRWLLTSRSPEPMRVIEKSMEQRRNARVGGTGDPRENPPTSGIVQHGSHIRKSGSGPAGVEPGSHWWEAGSLTVQSPRPPAEIVLVRDTFYGRCKMRGEEGLRKESAIAWSNFDNPWKADIRMAGPGIEPISVKGRGGEGEPGSFRGVIQLFSTGALWRQSEPLRRRQLGPGDNVPLPLGVLSAVPSEPAPGASQLAWLLQRRTEVYSAQRISNDLAEFFPVVRSNLVHNSVSRFYRSVRSTGNRVANYPIVYGISPRPEAERIMPSRLRTGRHVYRTSQFVENKLNITPLRTRHRRIGPYYTGQYPVLYSVHYWPVINQWRAEQILTKSNVLYQPLSTSGRRGNEVAERRTKDQIINTTAVLARDLLREDVLKRRTCKASVKRFVERNASV